MIDIRKLKELVRLMVENDLAELDLRDKEETVLIKRGAEPILAMPAVHAPPVRAASADGSPAEATPSEGEDESLVAIESPMVGTFYSSPNPDADPFVRVGDAVTPESVVCIIEAMKVFNEIKAECSGSIARVLIAPGDAVEFGQKLFLVRPS